jgi:hypothetical protein
MTGWNYVFTEEKLDGRKPKEVKFPVTFIIKFKTCENIGTELTIEHSAKKSRRVYQVEKSRILMRMTK